MSTPASPASATAPCVVGFEMPGAVAADDDAIDQVLSALLAPAPGAAWLSHFAAGAAAFKRQHRLKDLRVVGSHLSAVGPREHLRKLTEPVRQLVQQIGRDEARGRAPAIPPAALAQRWADPRLVAAIPRIPQILEEISTLTGMRFTAMSRVDDVRWTALAFYDDIAFGMVPGQELDLEATICGEVRLNRSVIAFGQASTDPAYACHPLPGRYGFESYLSVPIFGPDGAIFGTVCALDPDPRELSQAMLDAIQAHATWLGTQLPALVR